MEMIDLVYRFCCSWIFYHIFVLEQNRIYLNLIFSLVASFLHWHRSQLASLSNSH